MKTLILIFVAAVLISLSVFESFEAKSSQVSEEMEISLQTPLSSVTPFPTATLIPITPQAQTTPLTYQNTPIPTGHETITAQNLDKLTLAAQWGRGNIVRVAYAPDGRFFFIGSAYGVGVYDVRVLNRPLAWIPFQSFEWLMMSEDGEYLRVTNRVESIVYHLQEQILVEMPTNVGWVELITSTEGDLGRLKMVSPDGKLEFSVEPTCVQKDDDEPCLVWETSREKITHLPSGKVLYDRYDPIGSILYTEYARPEGCDLPYLGSWGNEWITMPKSAYRAAFSPDSKTFAVLYRPYGMEALNQFSLLRVYRTLDGKLLNAIGSTSRPVEDFAYAPDSRLLVAGFVDGSVQVWDLAQNEMTSSATHFDAPIEEVAYSADGKVLVVMHTNTVDIRMTRDGSLRARFEATAFALSPVSNLLALAGEDGRIRIINLNTWEDVHNIPAHLNTILSLAFSPDGTVLASSGLDCALKMWEVETGKFLHLNEPTVVDAYGEWYTTSRIFVYDLEFTPGTPQLLGFGSWGTVVSWNTDSGAAEYVVELAQLVDVGMKMPYPQFPEFFGVEHTYGLFYLNELSYYLNDGILASPTQNPAGLPQGCRATGPVTADGMLRFTLGYEAHAGQVCVLDNSTLELVFSLLPQVGQDVGGLTLSPDGSQLIAYTYSGVMYVFEIGG